MTKNIINIMVMNYQEKKAIDIDDISDWKIAEFFYKYKNRKI